MTELQKRQHKTEEAPTLQGRRLQNELQILSALQSGECDAALGDATGGTVIAGKGGA